MRALAVAAVIAAAALAGCGGGSKSAAGTGSAHGGKITISLGGKAMSWAPIYVADAKGYFKDQGYSTDIVTSSQGAPAAVAAMVSGNADVAMVGTPAAVLPALGGAPTKLLFNDSSPLDLELVASNKFLASKGLTPASPLAEKVRALKGTTIGIDKPGDSHSQFLKYLFAKYGMDVDKDARLLSLQNPTTQLAALRKGSIDLFDASPPAGEQTAEQGIGKIYIRSSAVPGIAQLPYLVGAVRSDSVTKDPAMLKAVVKAAARGISLLKEHPDQGRPIIRKVFPELNDHSFDLAYAAMQRDLPDGPLLTRRAYDSIVGFEKIQGKPVKVPYDDLVVTDLAKSAVDELGSQGG